MNAATGNDTTMYFTMLPNDYSALGADIITDLMFSPSLSAAELQDDVKPAITNELGRRQRDDTYRVHTLFFQALFKEDAYGFRPSLDARLKSVSGLNHDKIMDNYALCYTPAHSMFAVGGNFNPDSLCDVLAKAITEKFVQRDCHGKKLREYSGCKYSHVSVQDPVKAEHLVLGFKAIDFDADGFYAMKILNYLIGGKPSARIPYKMREEEHISYATWSYYEDIKDKGLLLIYTDADPKKNGAKRAEEVIISELLRIRKDGPTPVELDGAKAALIGKLKTLDGTTSRVENLHYHYFASGRLILPEEKIMKTNAVTFDDVMRVAREVIPAEFTPESYASARIIAKPE